MQLRRNEILTGVLVLATVAVLTGILILLGAPGLFKPLVTYKIYLDNAAGIKLGAPVLLAGRKIGQVESRPARSEFHWIRATSSSAARTENISGLLVCRRLRVRIRTSSSSPTTTS